MQVATTDGFREVHALLFLSVEASIASTEAPVAPTEASIASAEASWGAASVHRCVGAARTLHGSFHVLETSAKSSISASTEVSMKVVCMEVSAKYFTEASV